MALPVLNTATYELEVPSSRETIKYRPFVVKEEKVLLTVLETQDMNQITQVIRDIIETCTFNKLDINKLAMYDLEYIFLKIRAKSVGETSTVLLECSKCQEKNEVTINLDQIKLKGNPQAEAKVQVSDDVGIKMRFPTVHTVERMMKDAGDSTVDIMLGLIASSIDSIWDAENVYDAKDHTPQELLEFLESLSKEQFEKVQEFFGEFPKMSEEVKFDCTKCGSSNDMVLEGLADFFG